MIWLLLLLLGCAPKPCPHGCVADVAVQAATDIHAPCPESKRCADYLAYAARFGHARAGLDERLHELHRRAEAGETTTVDPPEDLRAAIIDATRIKHLLEGFDARVLEIQEVDRRPAAFGQEVDLRLRDPLIGRFNALLLLPEGEGPAFGVVALPGHGDSPGFHRDRYLGAELAAAGFAVLIVQLRNHSGGRVESRMAREMLRGDVPLVGLRIYEALLAKKVLRAHPRVDPDRIALFGHSGGADIASLVARIEPGKLVIDHQGEYLTVLADGRWLDDASMRLHRLHPWINEVQAMKPKPYQDAYEFPKGSRPIVRYLR